MTKDAEVTLPRLYDAMATLVYLIDIDHRVDKIWLLFERLEREIEERESRAVRLAKYRRNETANKSNSKPRKRGIAPDHYHEIMKNWE